MKKIILAAAGALMFASPAMAHKIHRPHYTHNHHNWMPTHRHHHCHKNKGYCHYHKHSHGGKGFGHHGTRFMHSSSFFNFEYYIH
mgnify:CR=1 FL=1